MLVSIALMILAIPSSSEALSSGPCREPIIGFILVPSGVFTVGSTVPIDIMFFHEGQPTDPDSIDVLVGETGRHVELTRISAGVYSTDLLVLKEDPEPSSGLLRIQPNGNYSNESLACYIEDVSIMTLPPGSMFDMDIVVLDPADEYPLPGQTVEFGVSVDYRGLPLDVDSTDLHLGLSEDPHFFYPYNATRVGPGRFVGALTVPDDIRRSTFYWGSVSVGGKDSPDPGARHDTILARLTLMNVWVHAISANSTCSTIEAIVTDRENRPLEGAIVNLSLRTGHSDILSSTTDADGRAVFQYDYSDGRYFHSPMMLWGNASHDGLMQDIMGYLFVPKAISPDPPGDGVSPRLLTKTPVPSGSAVRLDYILENASVPVAGKEYFLFISDYRDCLLWSGSVMTDGEGEFSIDIMTPSLDGHECGLLELYVEYQTYHPHGDEPWYRGFDIVCVGSQTPSPYYATHDGPPGVSVTHSEVKPGEKVDVTVTVEGADGLDERACVLWGLGYLPHSSDELLLDRGFIKHPGLYGAGWSTLYEGCICGWASSMPPSFVVPCRWKDGVYVATFEVPSFLPEGIDIHVVGDFQALDPAFQNDTIPSDPPTSPDTPDEPMLPGDGGPTGGEEVRTVSFYRSILGMAIGAAIVATATVLVTMLVWYKGKEDL